MTNTVIALDAAETLARFTADGLDPANFDAVIGRAIREAAASGRPVRAYGEMVALLWDAGDVLGAIELEAMWNNLARDVPFSLMCAYPAASVTGCDHALALHEVCGLHSAVFGATAVSRQFPCELAAPATARRFVEQTLSRHGCQALLVHDAALAVTEMATNAVVHGRSAFSVAVEVTDEVVRIEVRDSGPMLTVAGERGPLASSGRGLRLVAAVATQWGVETAADGKMLWAELPLRTVDAH